VSAPCDPDAQFILMARGTPRLFPRSCFIPCERANGSVVSSTFVPIARDEFLTRALRARQELCDVNIQHRTVREAGNISCHA
jgi:hypothetical protein